MGNCPQAHRCRYIRARETRQSSSMVSVNYAYWLTAFWPKQTPPSILFLDECHLLSDVVLDFAGCTITERQRQDWGLPMFPMIKDGSGMMLGAGDPIEPAVEWLTSCRAVLRREWVNLKHETSEAGMKRKRACQNLGRKMGATIDALRSASKDWFIRSGPRARSFRGKRVPGLVCRPLTARHHFPGFFLRWSPVVVVSATVGNFGAFIEELGIPRTDYEGHRVPNQWPPESRPVFDLGAPRMGYKSTESDYNEQADLIARAILDCPKDWSGLVHVTRISEAGLLAERLARRGLQDRVWVPPKGVGTDGQVIAWESFKKRTPGAIAVVYSWKEGFDGTEEKIDIVAKVQFPFLGDEYEKARMRYSGTMYKQRTAWDFEQSLGRTRRGREIDYDIEGERRGLVAIADGNWPRIKKYLSESLRESIVKV